MVVALVMATLMYGVLTLAQRSTDSLRKGLEDYISKSTGKRGEITELSEASLIPDVHFNLKGVNVRDWEPSGKTYLHADNIYVSTPFWRLLIGSAYYAAFEVKKLDIASGFLFPKKINIAFAGISDPDPADGTAQFIIDGSYNALPMLATMEMDRKETRKGAVYGFTRHAVSSFKLGETEMEALVVRGWDSVSLESARLKRGDIAVEFSAADIGSRPLNVAVKGSLDGMVFNGSLIGKEDNITLKVIPETVNEEVINNLRHLLEGVLADLGLNKGETVVRLEIEDAAAQELKEKKDFKKQ